MFHYLKKVLNFIYIGVLMLIVIILLALQNIKDLLMRLRKEVAHSKTPLGKPNKRELAHNTKRELAHNNNL